MRKALSSIYLFTALFLLFFTVSHAQSKLAADRYDFEASKKEAESRQKDLQRIFSESVFQDFGKTMGISLEPKLAEKKPVVDKVEINGAILMHNMVGIPFNLSATAKKSVAFPEMEKLEIDCAILFETTEEKKRNSIMQKVNSFPEKFATWSDFLARKADKFEIRKKTRCSKNEVFAIEIISRPPGPGAEHLALLQAEDSAQTSGGLFLDGVDISGDGATVQSDKTQTKKKGGFLKGVGEFFRKQKGEKTQGPSGPQPDSGPVVSKKIKIAANDQAVFCPKLKLYFIAGNSPGVSLELNAQFRITGKKNDKDFVKNNLKAMEEFAGIFFDQAEKACKQARIGTGNGDEKIAQKPDSSANPDRKTITDNKMLVNQGKTEELSKNAQRLIEIQQKLQKLVPEYIPDNPNISDSETFETILSLLEEKPLEQIKKENAELEEATTNSGDGSKLGISAISTPADESVGPGEKFVLKIKVVNQSQETTPAAFKLFAVDPWTGRELARKLSKAGPGSQIVDFSLTAPAAGEATKKLDLEIRLEPLVGEGTVPKKISLLLRGSLSEADILNKVSAKIYSCASDLRIEGYALSDKEREQIFSGWKNSIWNNPGNKALFLKAFAQSPGEALGQIVAYVQPRGLKILEEKLAARAEKMAKEEQEQQKLSRLIKYYNLETSAYKRNAVIDYRIDPGYNLIDVLADNVVYDAKTGEVTGDLDETRQILTEEHWELMKKTMSAADRYALEAGDDGLPQVNKDNAEKIFANLSKGKDIVDYILKGLDLVKYYQDYEVLNAGQAENLARVMRRLAKAIADTQSVVGNSAGPLAKALKEYEGFFTRAARLSKDLNNDLKVSDVPGALGEMAESMAAFAGKISSRFDNFKNAVDGLSESGKAAPLVKNLKKAVAGLGELLRRSLDLSTSLSRNLIKFADRVIEAGISGAGKTLGKGLDAGQDASDWLNGKLLTSADEIQDLGKSAKGATEAKGLIGRLGKSLANKVKANKGTLDNLGHGVDIACVVLDYNTYKQAGQSNTEAFSRAIISGGIEKFAGSKYSPLGLINFGLSKGMDIASATLGLNDFTEKNFNMKTSQINFSTPVKIWANQSVNKAMDFYNSYVVTGNRLDQAKENEDKIIALTIAAENCLKMAQSSKVQSVKDAYMKQRKAIREEIRRLGGRTQ